MPAPFQKVVVMFTVIIVADIMVTKGVEDIDIGSQIHRHKPILFLEDR